MISYASFVDRMQVGSRSTSAKPTGEQVAAYDYSGAPSLPCRLFPTTVASRLKPYGHDLQADGVVYFHAKDLLTPLVGSSDAGRRHQVKINGIPFEVLSVETLDNGLVRRAAVTAVGRTTGVPEGEGNAWWL